MANPSDLYIRFLVTKGHDDQKKVDSLLKELGITSGVSQSDFDKQYDLVVRSVPSNIVKQIQNGIYEGDFLKWMNALEVKDAWEAEPKFAVQEKRRIWLLLMGLLDDPHVKLCLNGLLIKGVNANDIAELVNTRFATMLREDHVKTYKKYFFDPQRMTRKDWKPFLSTATAKEKHIYFTALTESLDILKTELELPSDISVSQPLQILLTKAYQKAKIYLDLSTPEANKEARAWISVVSDLTGKYEKYRTGDKTDFAKQLQMQFEFVDDAFPTADAETLASLQEELSAKKE